MYNLKVTNNYRFDVTVGDQTIAKNGGTGTVGPIGNAIFDIPGMGSMAVLDLGDKKIPGYANPDTGFMNETWGTLMRYKTVEIYARYEGEGSYDLTIDEYGTINVTASTGSIVIADLPEFVLG